VRVRFLGSGDAFGSGGRFNTCILVERSEPRGGDGGARGSLLVDCGASSMIAMRRFGVDPNAIATVVLSHLHGDHFGGLPFFVLDAQLYSRRTAPLTVVGPPGTAERLGQAMEALFPGSSRVSRKFATEVREIAAREAVEIDGVRLTAYPVEHACGAPPFALRLSCDGKVLAYTGDTEWTESLLEAGRDADLLIAEALFFDKRVKFHLDYATLRAALPRIGARRVILTHLGPDMLARLAEVSEETAEDGMVVEL